MTDKRTPQGLRVCTCEVSALLELFGRMDVDPGLAGQRLQFSVRHDYAY